jgi:N-acetylglucosaminyldiphosphoundecaprenol N-acetyl-beta-D-mannosaminyltransferase
MMAWGLEWLYRLAMEPGRLWKRYLFHNPVFVILFGWQLVLHWLKGGVAE